MKKFSGITVLKIKNAHLFAKKHQNSKWFIRHITLKIANSGINGCHTVTDTI